MCRGFPLPPAILTPSFAYVIFLIEPYGGWPDGNCTLSCINHISALFLSKSGMCLFPDNAALSSTRKTLLTFLSSAPIILTAKRFPNVKEDRAKGGCVLAVCVGDFPLPPAILTPSLAYAILSTEPYGGWRDGNCTLSCISHISALFLSKSGMCLFPDNAALSSAENSLEKFSLQYL